MLSENTVPGLRAVQRTESLLYYFVIMNICIMNISFLEQLIPLPLIVTDNVNYLLPQYIGNLEKQD